MLIHSFNDLLTAIWLRKLSYVIVFFVVYLFTYGLLSAVDFLPEPITHTQDETPVESVTTTLTESHSEERISEGNSIATVILSLFKFGSAASSQAAESTVNDSDSVAPASSDATVPEVESLPIIPVALQIPRLNKTVTVLNPQSRLINDLDAALLSGVVRHPDSARLDQEGNVFILGHSSYLPVVTNRNFQAFNGIQNLEWGDIIVLMADNGMEYTYRVERVYRARAEEVVVPIAGVGHRLTLATCNSFGSIDDRYMVESVRVL